MFSLLKRSFFRKVFFSYMIIIGSITSIFLGVFYQQFSADQKERAQAEYAERADIMCNAFDRKLDDITTIGTEIRNTTWYAHAISTGPYYDDYFTFTSKQEITKELLRYKAIAGVVDTLAVMFPQRKVMISSPGWGDASAIMKLIGIKDLTDQEILTSHLQRPQYFELLDLKSLQVSKSFPFSMAIVQGVDYTSLNPRASLLILLNNNTLDNYICKFKPDTVTRFSILWDGKALYTYRKSGGGEQTAGANAITIRKRSQNYPCEYEIQIEPGEEAGALNFGLVMVAAAVIVLFFLLAAGISYLLTRVSYRPIASLLRQTETGKQEDEFAGIEGSFRKLRGEKEKMEWQMQQYYSAARGSFLLSLLRGYFVGENAEQVLSDYHIPYDNRQTFRVILCSLSGESELASRKHLQVFLTMREYLESRSIPTEFVELSATEAAFILSGSCCNDETTRRLVEGMKQRAQEKTDQPVMVYCGNAEKQLLGISKSFQSAKERLTNSYLGHDEQQAAGAGKDKSYYYPTDWEIQLINSLKVGNEKTALKIIGELRNENAGRALPQETKIRLASSIFETIIRVVYELGMDTVEPTRQFEENVTRYTDKKQWQSLTSLAQDICRRLSGPDGSSAGNVGRKMLSYVEQNYQNSALSLKDLSREFNLSASAVSRTFKATAKICFYDYLCRIRMEQAKDFFRRGTHSVGDVAKQVGYENELSFRRAFLRYEGITPRDYMMRNSRP